MEIVILDGYTMFQGAPWPEMEALGQLRYYDQTPVPEIASRIGNAEIVLVNKQPVDKEVIKACPNIKYIGLLATGYNNVDIEYARERGIIVTNIPTYGSDSVAQFVFAHILNYCQRVEYHAQTVKEGRWTNCRDFCYWDFPLIELSGKTFGIIGYGRIGRVAAKIALGFGMTVLADDHGPIDENDPVNRVPLEEIYKQADFISLHCPLTDETRGMINMNALSLMKKTAVIVNTSRGPLVNEPDMVEALKNNRIAALLTDVAAVEPIKADNPLLKLDNCIITPHIAWATDESRHRLACIAVENIKSFMDGKPVNVVNG
ncbi:MAG: D-2-hydroxyacid dehydrogenase [Clostridiales bacterium]|nr:D-2-hydroxyacid dehydrogenase [Clostridiales bacterium]